MKRSPWYPWRGYVARRVTLDDGRATTELQHRWVMERALGRRLESSEHVHHVNGDKSDNRPENLEVLSKADHCRRHSRPARVVSVVCAGCSAVFAVPYKRRHSAKYCGRSCLAAAAGKASRRACLKRSGIGELLP